MHDGIAVIGGHDHHLIVGQHLFQLAYFGQTARPFGDLSQPMQFQGFDLLEVTFVPHGMVVVQVLVTLVLLAVRSRRHEGPRATETVLVANLDTTVFAFHHIDEGVGAEFTTSRTAGRANVGQVHHEGIVHGKVLVGVQESRHLFEQMTRGTVRLSPIPHP